MAVLVTKWFGSFVVEEGRVTQERRFPLAAAEVAGRLRKMRMGEVLAEEQALAAPGLQVLEPRLKPLGRMHEKALFFDLQLEEPDRRILHEAAVLVGREESRLAAGEKDRFLAQAVRSMDELDKTVNALVERIKEWYGLHFPEALPGIADPVKLVGLLADDPSRGAMARASNAPAGDSLGVEFGASELSALQGLASSLRGLYEERAKLESLVESTASSVAPNLSLIVGPLIAAKLIAKAGSLERLAFLPASTLQTLGAETSLFQHLKEGTKPPKHGILFQHALVNAAPRWQRGRFARILAGHALLAARFDHFRGTLATEAQDLKASVERQAKRVKASKPPQAKPRGGPPPWKQKRLEGRAPPARPRGAR